MKDLWKQGFEQETSLKISDEKKNRNNNLHHSKMIQGTHGF